MTLQNKISKAVNDSVYDSVYDSVDGSVWNSVDNSVIVYRNLLTCSKLCGNLIKL